MATTVHMGYVGQAKIKDTWYLMTGSSLNATQAVEAPDTVGGAAMRKGAIHGKIEIGGNITGPIHEYASELYEFSMDRTTELDHMANQFTVLISYYQKGGTQFDNCVVNSLQLSCTAGEVATFTLDVIGLSAAASNGAVANTSVPCSKLMTWDQCTVTGAPAAMDQIQSINMTLNNNVQRAYVIGQADFFPADIPCGFREMSGTISAYAEGSPFDAGGGADTWAESNITDATALSLAIGTVMTMNCVKPIYHRAEGQGQTGPAIYTLNYTGICEPSGMS